MSSPSFRRTDGHRRSSAGSPCCDGENHAFEARVIDRSTPFDIVEGAQFTTCSAEDLLVLKAFADRAQDWLDIEGVIVRQGPRLDRALVMQELRPLLELKEDEAAEARLVELFTKHQR
jgi:hypothetical protein